jgi:hypothetical protein
MLVAKETIDRDIPRQISSFQVGETVQVVSLGRVGRVVGLEGGRWLVQLTEGDTPVRCNTGDLQKRSTLLG